MTPRAPELPSPYRPPILRDDSTHSKLSIPVSSQSNEADDEQSPSNSSYDMESSVDSPQYEGEDTRLTSEKELSGFYMYGWAAEVYHHFPLSTSLSGAFLVRTSHTPSLHMRVVPSKLHSGSKLPG
jgi:hypothetical protein